MSDQIRASGLYLHSASRRTGELPALLRTTTRSGSTDIDPLLSGLAVEATYTLGAVSRGGLPAQPETVRTEGNRVLALEAEDGSTLFIHADKLNEDVARLRPDAVVDGAVDLDRFRDPDAANRGLVDVVWKAVSVLRLPADGLAEQAMELARQWAGDQAQDAPEQPLAGMLWDTASFLGAKALMWQIESSLAGRPGLYHWHGTTITASDLCLPGDPRLEMAAAGQPMLLFIHGTASYTLGGFADLQADETTWTALQARFPGGIFGYEHRSFSQSPQENALELLGNLPPGARLSLVTHSRGGLVGDLLCLGQVADEAIDAYHIDSAGASDLAGLEREAAEERDRLRQILKLIDERRISVERYVRVACPARGTRFLSDNLDVALSDLLNLLQWGGGAMVGVAAAAFGGPAAGETFGGGASSALGVLKRLVLEIAGRRIDPRMIPGIAAMRTDSPLAVFLANPGSRRRDGIDMAVIAGDTEFSGLGLSNLGRRVANLFCDWRLFDDYDNDLVVDTDSMYAGLGFRSGTHYLYDQGESVSHFRYFCNPLTRDALRGWLVNDLGRLPQFQPLADGSKLPWKEADTRRARGGAIEGARPVVVILPGIMGSHVAVRNKQSGNADRIWFNFPRLSVGQLDRIADTADPTTFAEDLWERFYGDLADFLAASHAVIRCPYDWRLSIEDGAEVLEKVISKALHDHPGQPIRLLAHSMGGLVARTLMQRHPDRWQQVVASGGRLLMLGTPNNGAHLTVHTLLGKTSSMRGLEKLDGKHDLQQILDIVARFPGALSLLPRPGWSDTGSEARGSINEYYSAATWEDLKARNTDRWYGDRIAAVPTATQLVNARSFWTGTLPANTVSDPERVSYVFGQGEKTPCGVLKTADGHLQLLFTNEGDGSVTWQSGRLDNLPENDRCWYLPAEHSDLSSEAEHFPALLDLLASGRTDQLERLPRSRGSTVRTFVLEAPPPVILSEDELARAVFGSGPRRRARPPRTTLRVAVRAGDLRFLDQPLICGHYLGDPIAAAEARLDEELDGRLGERERLGVYAGEIGTSAIVLPPRSGGETARGSRPGAVIVGLGDFNGQLGAWQITASVRAAVLRLLLLLRDTRAPGAEQPVQLYSLLLGCNSSAQISVDESVAAVTCGVLEANRQFAQALAKSGDPGVPVAALTFVELYRDVAISAAHAVTELPRSLASQLQGLGARLEVAGSLEIGKGVRERLSAEENQGYWSRLVVSDPDVPADDWPAACPEEDRDRHAPVAAKAGRASAAAPGRYLPERLKYVFLSRRARAESLVQQRQPGLIEVIISRQRLTDTPNPKLGQMLFQLLVPADYKAAARARSRLLLILDSYTASLPWELLQADREPLAISTPVVRQLITTRFRGPVPTASSNSACIIVAPGTQGFNRRFGGSIDALPELPGAIAEGEAVRAILRQARWNNIVFCADGREAIDVLADLYQQPYRLLTICGHGIFEAEGLDGHSYSGVVLSDGLLITAVEIGLMEVVPEVVFLSCCHLGSMSHAAAQPNRLAYSLARELIDIGVRCVVAAGWAVNDAAAKTFATTFFEKLTAGAAYGEAVFQARKTTYADHPGSSTWGAYQAYGDPAYRLGPNKDTAGDQQRHHVAVEELLDRLETRRLSHATRHALEPGSGVTGSWVGFEAAWVRAELARCPGEWSRRPDVLQGIGALYAELGDDGFEPAREAYLAALQSDDPTGRVACRLVEQVANLEARRGSRLVEQNHGEAGQALLDSAIDRLKALGQAVNSSSPVGNPERTALLGSALKRQAAALARTPKPEWIAIAGKLAEAAAAYFKAAAASGPAHAYHTLNALPLAWLSGTLPPTMNGPELARQCGDDANRRFRSSQTFWDAAAGPDSAVVAWLLGGNSADTDSQLELAYRQLADGVPHTAREWDSVSSQLRLLATFLDLRQHAGDRERAATLRGLADLPARGPAASIIAKPTARKRSRSARKPAGDTQ